MVHVIDLNFLSIPYSIASFLVETSIGPILIETGPTSTFPSLKKALAASGYKIEDVKHVFLSHIHLDHAGAAWKFAEKGAKIYLHPLGVSHINDPTNLISSAKRIYKEDMDRLWGPMNAIDSASLISVEDGQIIPVGDTQMISWHTPGHAKHHIAWQLNNSLFTGDVAGVRIGKGPVVPPCPPPDINIEDWKASIDKIRKLKLDDLYLTHYGKAENINPHLDSLVTNLDDWAQWIKTRWMKGQATTKIVLDFQDYVNKQLVSSGLKNLELKQYEAANPAWMSVDGLLRYWKKKVN